jgi:RHS repeat-associated protein
MLLTTGLEGTLIQAISAAAQRSFVFTAYGHRQASSGPPSLGYNGVRFEALTNHYLLGNGYRAYNPVLMRFNSPDSLSPFGKGGLNSYAYCAGDPLNRADPSGHINIGKGLGRLHRLVPSVHETTEIAAFSGYAALKDLKSQAVDAFSFVDAKRRRYNFSSHGNESHVYVDGQPYTGTQLYEKLRADGETFAGIDSVGILACNSATLGPNSPAAQFARASGLPTKGYQGELAGNAEEVWTYLRTQPDPAQAVSVVRDGFGLLKKIESSAPGPNINDVGVDLSAVEYNPRWFGRKRKRHPT